MRGLPLSGALRAALEQARGADLPDEDLERELARIVDDARRAWPSVEVDAVAFVAYLGARVPDGSIPQVLRTLHVPDLYLAYACSTGDPAALAAFERTILSDLDARIVPAAGERLDEIRQLVAEKLLVGDAAPPRITAYRGSGALHAWVRVTAVRIALDLVRKPTDRRTLAEASLDADLRDPSPDPELAHLKLTYRNEIKRSIETAAAQLSARERNLLRHSLLDGLTIDDFAALYRVHRATAARWLGNARDALAAATKRDLAARLGLRADDLASVMRVVDTQLEVSWSRFRE